MCRDENGINFVEISDEFMLYDDCFLPPGYRWIDSLYFSYFIDIIIVNNYAKHAMSIVLFPGVSVSVSVGLRKCSERA